MTSWLSEMCGGGLPHGTCFLWDARLVWLHAITDALIALSYYSIPFVLLRFVRARKDLPYPLIFLMFGVFIVACGTTHAMEVATIWYPLYWISGYLKAVTAAVSVATAICLVRIYPMALALPGPSQLKSVNESLEERVRQRTAELSTANAELQREIAQRKRGDEEIQRLNLDLSLRVVELQTLIDVLPVGVAIADDPSCTKVRPNRALAEMIRLGPEETSWMKGTEHAARRGWKVLVKGSEPKTADLPIPLCARTDSPVYNFELQIVHNDGTTIDVVENAVPLRHPDGRVRGVLATFQDVSAKNKADRALHDFDLKLLQTQKLESLGILAGGIAHDFNNLLTGILGNASLARGELAADSLAGRSLAEIEAAGRRAADLCRQMLAYAGKGRFVVVPINLNDLVRETLQLLKSSISKRATLRMELSNPLPLIEADLSQINQLVMNLAINASEALGDKEGTITLATAAVHADRAYLDQAGFGAEIEEGDYVTLDVADDGCGMSAETKAHIFDPFFTTKFTGRGLGLAAVIGIVRGNQGAIRVYSELGKGSTFRVLLPASAAKEPSASKGSRPPIWKGSGKVLVIDDEEAVRRFLSLSLAKLGLAAQCAHDGAAGLSYFAAGVDDYSAVLLDLTMPGLDGEQVFERIRERRPDIPVILMSGFNRQETVGRLVASGYSGFLQKPFTLEQLSAGLRIALKPSEDNG